VQQALCEIWDMNEEEDEEEVDEDATCICGGGSEEGEGKWMRGREHEDKKGCFSASASKYECYEINERSFFTGCLICFGALKSGTVYSIQ
jgi:hypothetical protein